MATVISSIDAARDDFEAYYDTHWDILPEQYTPIVVMDSDAQGDYRAKEVGGLGLPIATGEKSPYNVDSRNKINEKTWDYVKYTLGLEVSDEAKFTDRFGTFENDRTELVKAFKQNRNLQAANLFNNAWDSAYTGPDSLTLASTAHTTNGGTTFANEPAVHAALSPTSLKEGLSAIRTQKDSRGRRMYATNKVMLFVAPELEFAAKEIVRSQQLPYTGDNTVNTYSDRVEMMVLDEVTIEDFWGLTPTDSMEKPFFMVDRMPFRVETDRAVRNGVDMLYAHEEFLVGWRLPYRTWLVSVTEG